MPSKNSKIIATVGPANADEHTLRCLMEAGADVFRLNFSHGRDGDHRTVYRRIRALEERPSKPIGVLIDLQGPKLRLGVFIEGCLHLEALTDGSLSDRNGVNVPDVSLTLYAISVSDAHFLTS